MSAYKETPVCDTEVSNRRSDKPKRKSRTTRRKKYYQDKNSEWDTELQNQSDSPEPREPDNRLIFHVDGSCCEAGNMHPRGVGCDADFYDDEARALTRASDRRSDRTMGGSQNLYGKYTTVQVETVDDLGWGSTPIAYLFAEEKSDGFWRLQTEDVHLKKQMKPRVWNARSPWHLTGRSSTTCIFRRWFSSTRNVHQTIRRILARGASECSFVRHKVQIAFQNRFSGKNGRKAIHIEKKMMPLWVNQTLTSSVKLHVGARLIWL